MWCALSTRDPNATPLLGDELSDEFLAAIERPALLTLPVADLSGKAADFSGHRNLGSLNGGVTVVPSGYGALGAAWQFDGTPNTEIALPLALAKSFTGQSMTIAICFRIADLSHVFELISASGNNGALAFDLQVWQPAISTSVLSFSIASSATLATTLDSTTPLSAQVWYLAVCTYALGGPMVIYLDAHFDCQATGPASQNDTGSLGLNLGNFGQFSNNPLHGEIGFAAMWRSALSAAQVAALHRSLVYGDPPLFAPSRMRRLFAGASGSLVYPARQPIVVPQEPFPFNAFDYN